MTNYVMASNDEAKLMSVRFFDLSLDNLVGQNSANTQGSILSAISGHSCRCSLSTNLGSSLNATVNAINARSLPKGVPKIIVLIVGSTSLDNVY